MTMTEWAEKEIEAAKKRERGDNPEDEWDYGCACYDSALKAYKSLCGDGHSGFSFAMTREILNKLMNHIPLSPITDEDFFVNNEGMYEESPDSPWLIKRGFKSHKQCPRRSSLFREEHLDGTITYSDVDRVVGRDVSSDITFTSGRCTNIVDEMFPITMPYTPSVKPYQITCDDFLFDKEISRWTDGDTEAYFDLITPDGKYIELNKFYKIVPTGEFETFPSTECEYVTPDPIDCQEQPTQTIVRKIEPQKRPLFERVEITKEEYLERKKKN